MRSPCWALTRCLQWTPSTPTSGRRGTCLRRAALLQGPGPRSRAWSGGGMGPAVAASWLPSQVLEVLRGVMRSPCPRALGHVAVALTREGRKSLHGGSGWRGHVHGSQDVLEGLFLPAFRAERRPHLEPVPGAAAGVWARCPACGSRLGGRALSGPAQTLSSMKSFFFH